jgi:prevent-host-death family protein
LPSYNVHEAKSNLSKLLKQTAQGAQVIIMRDGKPVAQLIPYAEKPNKKLKLGWARNQVVHVTPGWEKAMGDKEVEAMFGGGL